MPTVSIEAMNKHLAEISQCVSLGAIALLILDGAGWHGSPRLVSGQHVGNRDYTPGFEYFTVASGGGADG